VRFAEQLDEMFYEKDHIKSRLGAKTGTEYKLHHYGFLDITDEGNLPNSAEESKDDPQSAAPDQHEVDEEPKDGGPKPDEPQPDNGCDAGASGGPTAVFTYSYQKLKDRVRWYSERAKEDFEWSRHLNRNCMGLRIVVPGLWVFPELSPAPGDPYPPYDAGLDDGEISGDLSGFSQTFESKMLVAWFTRFDNLGYDSNFFTQQDILGRAHALSSLV